MSLWLATLAREHPLTFLDHALRHGDSLVGLSRRQIEAFHWDVTSRRLRGRSGSGGTSSASPNCAPRSARPATTTSDFVLRDLWDEAQSELGTVRLFGDLAVHAFFSADKTKAREAKRDALAAAAIGGSNRDHAPPRRGRRASEPRR